MYMLYKIILEAIAYSLLYSAFMLVLFLAQGARKQLYNYPPAIQKRAIERGITRRKRWTRPPKRTNPSASWHSSGSSSDTYTQKRPALHQQCWPFFRAFALRYEHTQRKEEDNYFRKTGRGLPSLSH